MLMRCNDRRVASLEAPVCHEFCISVFGDYTHKCVCVCVCRYVFLVHICICVHKLKALDIRIPDVGVSEYSTLVETSVHSSYYYYIIIS
jgi:hypothetical protein